MSCELLAVGERSNSEKAFKNFCQMALIGEAGRRRDPVDGGAGGRQLPAGVFEAALAQVFANTTTVGSVKFTSQVRAMNADGIRQRGKRPGIEKILIEQRARLFQPFPIFMFFLHHRARIAWPVLNSPVVARLSRHPSMENLPGATNTNSTATSQ